MPDWWQLALGPLGALVIALSGAIWNGRELKRVQAEQIARLESLLANRVAECADLSLRLQTEHAARLEDARQTTKTLLELNDRIHRTLDGLEALARMSGTNARSPP